MGPSATVDEVVLAVSRRSPTVDRRVIRRLVRSVLLAESNLSLSLQNVLALTSMTDSTGQFGLINIQTVLAQIRARKID